MAADLARPVRSWSLYMLLLGIGIRFIHHALFDGTMFSLHYYIVDTIVLMIFGIAGFRYKRTKQMVDAVLLALRKSIAFSLEEQEC